jgi:deoxyribodipyrimidine photo-lyase
LLWFRQDLRLADNPALEAALKRGAPVIPVYLLDDAGDGRWAPGGAARWWLHRSLSALAASLRERGSRLVLLAGDSAGLLAELARTTGAGAVYWNRRYEPAVIDRDKIIKAQLAARGLDARSFNSALLFEPHTITNKQGGPYQVFTPFWRHCQSLPVAEPSGLRARNLPAPESWPESLALEELRLQPAVPWDKGLQDAWIPGEAAAQARLRKFMAQSVDDYADRRNRPDVDGSSRLSPHLHFGELGPRQVWAAAKALGKESGVFPPSNGARVFLAEIGWREFAHHLLYHFPQTAGSPLRKEFASFPWAEDPAGAKLRAWRRGLTGYPIVDAGMRQLWRTGWMHNRVRMIAASFLVKHLRLDWTHGARWFWDTLVDADLASNTLGWQWTAGCGADAAPYFRVFAPVLQGVKFDPQGRYVREWLPELRKLSSEYIHSPWEAPATDLATAGVRLGVTYPHPVVDHGTARRDALEAWRMMRQSSGQS